MKIIIPIIILALIVVAGCEYSEDTELLPQELYPNVTEIAPPEKVYLNVTHEELEALTNAWMADSLNYTDLQKEEIFNEMYKGKYIIWEGKVRDLDKKNDNEFELDVTIKESSSWLDVAGVEEYYVRVYLDESQYSKLIVLREGENVTFSGKFNDYGTITWLEPSFYFTDGEIITKD